MTSLSYVTITGTFEGGDGTGSIASPQFQASQVVLDGNIPVVVPSAPVPAQILSGLLKNASGGSLSLLATSGGENSNLRVQGSTGFWFWTCTGLSSLGIDDFSFFLPNSPATVDITALINSPASGGGVTSVFSRTGTVTAQSGDYTAAQVGADASGLAAAVQANLTTEVARAEAAEAARLQLAGGTMTGWLAPAVSALTDGATISVNAALGDVFTVVLGGNRTIAAPTNPVAGQAIVFEIAQPASGGPFTPAFASGAGAYSYGSGSAPTWSTAASAVDQIAFRYSSRKGAWLYQGSVLGF